MKALTKIVAGGVALAALTTAAPAAAQYYPNPYGYGQGGNVIGQVLNQVLGGGTYGYNQGYGYNNGYGNSGYGANQQVIVNQCINAVQARLNSTYAGGYSPYGYNNGYGYNGYGQARVLGVSRIEPRSNGGLTVRGVANSGAVGAYGNSQAVVDLTFRCRADYRGYITSVDIDRAQGTYGYNSQPYDPYAQYGYRRY